MIIPHYYEDPHTLHVGTMPNRAYYIPASRRDDALVEHRETSGSLPAFEQRLEISVLRQYL